MKLQDYKGTAEHDDALKELISAGGNFVPCQDKAPILGWSHTRRRLTYEESRTLDYEGLGFVPDSLGLCVIDMDGGGRDALNALIAKRPPLLILKSKTPGHWHLFYDRPEGRPRNGKFHAFGVIGDYRQTNYIRLWDAEAVEKIRAAYLSGRKAPLPESETQPKENNTPQTAAPEKPKPPRGETIKAFAARLEKAKRGERHISLYGAACAEIRKWDGMRNGLRKTETYKNRWKKQVVRIMNRKLTEPLPEKEAQGIAEHIYEKHDPRKARPRPRTAEDEDRLQAARSRGGIRSSQVRRDRQRNRNLIVMALTNEGYKTRDIADLCYSEKTATLKSRIRRVQRVRDRHAHLTEKQIKATIQRDEFLSAWLRNARKDLVEWRRRRGVTSAIIGCCCGGTGGMLAKTGTDGFVSEGKRERKEKKYIKSVSRPKERREKARGDPDYALLSRAFPRGIRPKQPETVHGGRNAAHQRSFGEIMEDYIHDFGYLSANVARSLREKTLPLLAGKNEKETRRIRTRNGLRRHWYRYFRDQDISPRSREWKAAWQALGFKHGEDAFREACGRGRAFLRREQRPKRNEHSQTTRPRNGGRDPRETEPWPRSRKIEV